MLLLNTVSRRVVAGVLATQFGQRLSPDLRWVEFRIRGLGLRILTT